MDETVKSKIKQLLKEGKSKKQIAEETGIPYATICYNIRKINKIEENSNQDFDDKLTKIKQLLKEGKSKKQIAEETGIPYATVCYNIRKINKIEEKKKEESLEKIQNLKPKKLTEKFILNRAKELNVKIKKSKGMLVITKILNHKVEKCFNNLDGINSYLNGISKVSKKRRF